MLHFSYTERLAVKRHGAEIQQFVYDHCQPAVDGTGCDVWYSDCHAVEFGCSRLRRRE